MKNVPAGKGAKPATFSATPTRQLAHPVISIYAATDGQLMLPALLSQLPVSSGFSFIIYQQTAPEAEGLPPALLQTHTAIPVELATDTLQIRPDTIYVLEANVVASIAECKFLVSPRSEGETETGLAEFFMMNQARQCKALSLAILLGHTASQFAEGIKYVKAEGGIVLAQKAAGAQEKGYTHNSLECADRYFLPEDISAILNHFFSDANCLLLQKINKPDSATIKNITGLIYSQKHIDLSLYKPEIMNRRIARRMRLKEVATAPEYFEILTSNIAELDALSDELLLSTSRFFQDASVYRILSHDIFPKLLSNRKETDTLRIWCPACHTGQEVYSIAICLLEYLKANELKVPIQIFATDLSKESIRKAHWGYYSANAVQNVSPQRLATYFEKKGDQYQVVDALRDICVFATHLLQKDSPFPRLDLISYQNELTTLDNDHQQKVLQSFHYGLKADGFLIINKSERLDENKFFFPISSDHHIFNRIAGSISNIGYGFNSPFLKKDSDSNLLIAKAFKDQDELADIERASEKLLLSRYVPASIVINSSFQIIRFHGPIHKYLQPSSGKASLTVLNMIQEDLAIELHGMVQQILKTGKPIRRDNITLTATYGGDTNVSIEIAPIRTVDIAPCYLVIFEERDGRDYSLADELEPAERDNQRLQLLEQDLKESREQLQNLTEEFRITREELQGAHEEVTANNEELQSLNEELKIEREELQESIKNVIAVNEEISTQNNALTEAADYSTAVMEAIQDPLVLLNSNLSIYTANKVFYATFKLLPAEVEGKFFYEIADSRWNVPDLLSKLSETAALKKKGMVSFEVPSPETRTLLFNAIMLETGNKSKGRIMVTIKDITQQRHAREAKEWLAAVVSASNEGIISFTTNRTIISWNKGAEEIFGYKESEMVCKSLSRLVRQGDKVAQHKMIERVMRGEVVRQEEIECVHQQGHRIYVSISMALMKDLKGNTKGLMASVQDITERKLAKQALTESEERYRPIVSESAVGIVESDFDGKLLFVNQKFCEMLNTSAEELLHKSLWDFCYTGNTELTKQRFLRMQADGQPIEYEKQLCKNDGTPIWVNINLAAIKNTEGVPISATAVIIDISQRKDAEEALQNAKESLQLALEAANMGIWEMGISNGEATYHSLRNDQIFGYDAWQPKWTIGMARMNVVEEDKHVFDEAVARLVEKGRLHMEVRVKWPDGSIHWVNKVGRLFYDKDGQPQRAAGVAMDITNRKLLEERKEEFISIASHELKTPVTSIKAYAQILQDQFLKKDDPASANMLGKLNKQVDKLTDLISDLLDTARLSEGQLALQPAVFDINSLVAEVAEDMQPSTNHQIIVEAFQPMPPVEADRERIRQVLVNLVSNAIKYSPAADKIIIRTGMQGKPCK